jgi:hypothetical protein
MRKFGFILLCIFVLAFAAGVQAQTGFGLKGGMTIAKLTGDNTENPDSRTGFMIGGYAAIPIGEGMAFQPEVYYAQKGAKFDADDSEVTVKFDYIDIPLLFKYTVAGQGAQPYFLIGPSVGINTKAEQEADGQTEDLSDNTKSSDFGLVFGIGVELQQFLIEARYSLGLSDINDFPDDPDSIKNSVIAFQVGYAFPTP